MIKKIFLIILAFLVCLCITAQAVQRNILLLIGDDLGIDSLHISNTNTNTAFPPIPAVELLANRGIIFSKAYACPTCSPTRSGILTGRNGWRTGVLSAESSESFSADEYTLPEIFADQGLNYNLASFGKWHLGGAKKAPNFLGGWPHFAGTLGGGLPDYSDWIKIVNGVSTNMTETYATQDTVTDAINWISSQGTNRWFAWIGFNAAHTPLHKPPNELHSYDYLSGDDTDISTNALPYFHAMIEAMDNQIAKLIENIDTNETTIIFIGDNGTATEVIQPPYDIPGRAKGSLYEGGTHVPFVIAGPDIISGGRTNDSVIHSTDLFATILELAGGTVPAGRGEDSRSLVPIIENKLFQPEEDCILVESDSLLGGSATGRGIRNAQYKLIRIDEKPEYFFDMNSDPLESNNLLSGTLTVDQQAAYDILAVKLDYVPEPGILWTIILIPYWILSRLHRKKGSRGFFPN